MKLYKKSDKLVYNLSCTTKEKALAYISTTEFRNGYIKSKVNKEYDIYLELYWENHCPKYIDYIFVGNIVDDKIIGEIKEAVDTSPKIHYSLKVKISDVINIIAGCVLFLLFIFGLPSLILYKIFENVLIAIIIPSLLLLALIVFIIVQSDNKKVHISNLNEFFKPIIKPLN